MGTGEPGAAFEAKIRMELPSWKSSFITLPKVWLGAWRHWSSFVAGRVNLEVGSYSLNFCICPGPSHSAKYSFNFTRRSSFIPETLASLTPVGCTVCATSFMNWHGQIDPPNPQGKRLFANIYVGKYHVVSPMKFGCPWNLDAGHLGRYQSWST